MIKKDSESKANMFLKELMGNDKYNESYAICRDCEKEIELTGLSHKEIIDKLNSINDTDKIVHKWLMLIGKKQWTRCEQCNKPTINYVLLNGKKICQYCNIEKETSEIGLEPGLYVIEE